MTTIRQLRAENDKLVDELHGCALREQRLRAALAIMWHAYDTDNRPPHNIVKLAKECYDAGKPALTNEQDKGGNMSRSYASIAETDVEVLAVQLAKQQAEIARLTARVKELVALLDQQMGTPCEQIRHEQEEARLRAALQRIVNESRDDSVSYNIAWLALNEETK